MPYYKITHLTRYTYATAVIDCTNQIMLYPVIDEQLEVKNHSLNISYKPDIEVFVDYFGNRVGVFSVVKPHTELLIESTAEVITQPVLVPMDEEPAEEQWKHLQDIKYNAAFIDFFTGETVPDDMQNSLRGITNYGEKPLKNALVLSEYVYDNFTTRKG